MLKQANKILLLTSSSTGNNIFCTPAIRLLRKNMPQAVLDVVTLNQLTAQVFEKNTDVNQCFVVNKSQKFDVLAKGYDAVLVLNKNALRTLKTIQTNYELVTPRTADMHHAEQVLQFVAQLLNVTVTDEDRHYVLQTNQTAEHLLEKHDLKDQQTVINIHLGCGTTLLHGWKFFYSRRADDKKLWSIDAYITLGQALQASIPNLRIVVTGTKNERFLAKKFKKMVPRTIDLTGQTTVSDLVALMKRADLFIAHDCGVFHIAVASDVPIVGLYGPTDPLATGPFPHKPQHHLIKKDTMAEITTAEVVDLALNLLRQFPRVKD